MSDVVAGNATVPFLISYRTVTRPPKLVRTRSYVGFRQTFKNLVIRAIDAVLESAYEERTELEDEGESSVKHWALHIGDSFDAGGDTAEVFAVRCTDGKPAAAYSVELIRFVDPDSFPTAPRQPVQQPSHREEIRDALRERLYPNRQTSNQRSSNQPINGADVIEEVRRVEAEQKAEAEAEPEPSVIEEPKAEDDSDA